MCLDSILYEVSGRALLTWAGIDPGEDSYQEQNDRENQGGGVKEPRGVLLLCKRGLHALVFVGSRETL